MKEIDKLKDALQNMVDVPVQTFEAVVQEVDEDEASCVVLINEMEIEDVSLRSIIGSEQSDGFFFVPKEESIVLVSRIRNSNNFYVSKFSQVDKFIVKTENTSLELNIPGEEDSLQISIGDKTSITINKSAIDIVQDKSEVNITDSTINVSQGDDSSISIEESKISLTQKDATIDLESDTITLNGGSTDCISNASAVVKQMNNIESDINDLKMAIMSAPTTAQDGGAAFKGGLTTWAGKPLIETTDNDIVNDKVKH